MSASSQQPGSRGDSGRKGIVSFRTINIYVIFYAQVHPSLGVPEQGEDGQAVLWVTGKSICLTPVLLHRIWGIDH